MEPALKSKRVTQILEESGQLCWGRSRIDSIKNNVCIACGEPVMEFKDEESKYEYSVSGFCLRCQNKMFAKGDGEDR